MVGGGDRFNLPVGTNHNRYT